MTDIPLLSSSYSRYAARVYAARPELADQVAALAAAPITRERIVARLDALCLQASATPGTPGAARVDEQLKKALRQLRIETLCAVMERDLARSADVVEVTGTMTDLAEVAIERALAVVSADLETLFGEPRGPNGERLTLGVVGMGKLGGRELNVSSDIDLIFVYEDDGPSPPRTFSRAWASV